MRTRKEIEKEIKTFGDPRNESHQICVKLNTLEVLLDIRDLLSTQSVDKK